MAITLRNTKGSALTHTELDGNFTDLDGRVLDSDGIRALVDSDYVQLRMSPHYTGFDSDFGTKSTTNLAEGDNLYYTTARFDSDLGTKTTTNITEGNNLYYTTARHDSDTLLLVDSNYVQARQSSTASITIQEEGSSLATAATTLNFVGTKITASGAGATKTITVVDGFDSDFGTKTTTDLAEGSNLYYTTARHDSDFTSSLNAATLAYATDSATLWNGTPPTTIDSALDRIALVVRTLNGGTGA